MNQRSFFSMLSTFAVLGRAQRWVFALCSAFAVLLGAASAQALTYNYALPAQTWARPPASSCNGTPKTTTTYATLQISLYGTATITATRATGSGISLTTYQGAFFPTNQCVNFWDTTNISTGASVSRSLQYSPNGFTDPSTFTIVVSGNSASDFANITVSATLSSGSTLALVCPTGTVTPDEVDPPSSGGNYSVSYVPPFGAIGCNAWTATSPDSWVGSISPTSGTGSGTVSFTLGTNSTGDERDSELDIGPLSNALASTYIYQDSGPSCSYSLSPTTSSVAASASSGSFTVSTTTGCAWTTSTSGSFVSGVTASGSGNGSVSYNVAANTGPARSATISAGGQTYTVNQASGCTYSLSASSGAPNAAGGTASVTVTPSSSTCAWTAASNASFVTGVTASGTGTGTVSYSVGSNNGTARSGTVTIAGQTFTVNQASGCTFTVSPTSASPSATAGSGSVTITASNAACPWTAANNDSWLAVSPSSGTGSQTVTYNVAVNAGPSRTGSLTVAGQTVTFNQISGCTASLSSNSDASSSAGGSDSVTLTMSSAACAWTASSNASWVTVPASGTGSGTVSFTVAAQVGPARTATLTIAGQTFSITQTSGCTYSINPSSSLVGTSAGASSVAVTTSDPTCAWNVGSNDSWLGSTTTASAGNQSVSYDYSANSGPSRTGTLTIAGQTLTVTQGSGCTASLSPSSLPAPATGLSSTFTLTMSSPSCAWTASSSDGFVSGVTSGGTGSGSVSFTVAANSGPARSATISAGGSTFTINQASGCTASLASSSANAVSAGGAGTIALTMSAATCPWNASSNASWLGSVSASGTGSASVGYNVAANSGVTRSGTITVAGQTFTVQQADGCNFTLAATSANAAAAGETGSIGVTASDAACSFTTSSQASWLTNVTAGTTGSATIAYTAAANQGQPRTGTLLIAGQTVTISQASGCVATLSTQAAPATSAGGSLTIGITMSGPTCTWDASVSGSFISNLVYTGTGSGSVAFDVAANTGIARTATVTIAGQAVTVTQASGCIYSINPTGVELDQQGVGPFSFALTASDASCPWTMQAQDSWLTANTPSGTGSAVLSYSSTVNLGSARTSSIDVGGRTFTVLQDDGCTATTTPSGTIDVSAGAQTTQFHLAQSASSCAWTATSSDSWLGVADTGGTGDGDVHLTVAANVGPERTVQVQLKGGQTVTVRQASGCAVSLPGQTGSAFASGGSSTFNVDTALGCGYTATTSDSWLSNIAVTATGVSYDVAATTETTRVGTITVTSTSTASTASYTVTQSSGCVVVLPAGGASPSSEGGSGSFVIQTSAGCGFSVATTTPWVVPVTVSGNTVSYQASTNLGPARSGKISVTSTDTGVVTEYAVSQATGCVIAIASASPELTLDKSGGAGSFTIATGEGCGVDISSPNAWLSIDDYKNGVVSFGAAENSDANRDGTIVVKSSDSGASATFTVHEASGCVITLPVVSAEVEIKGGSFTFNVDTGVGCEFKTESSDSWIDSASKPENGVGFVVEANAGIARTSTITVTASDTSESATYVVHQAGPITKPVIGTQPKGTRLRTGDDLHLEIVASGGDLHYQWRKNGVDIPGATSVEYRALSANSDDSGSYDVVISNDAGSVTSSIAVVVVSDAGSPDGNGEGGSGAVEEGAAGTTGLGEAGTSAVGEAGTHAGAEAGTGAAGNAPNDDNKYGPPYFGGGGCSLVGAPAGDLVSAMLGILLGLSFVSRRRRAK